MFLFKNIFLPFFSFNLKATFKEELYQKILTSITMLHYRSVSHMNTRKTLSTAR